MLSAKRQQVLFIILATLSWIYLWLKAISAPLVFDEATSFFNYIYTGNFLPGQAFWSANNHLLNSALAWLSYSLLGMEEWVLRLPNLLAFPVFAFFSFKLMQKLQSPSLRLLAILLLFSNHYLLEFFAFARGYGLMLAAILASLWYLSESWQKPTTKNLLKLWLSLSLGILSNVSWLPLMGLMVLATGWILIKNRRFLPLPLFLLPILYALWNAWQLKIHHQLYYGGEQGFISDSLESLVNSAFGQSAKLDLLLSAGALFVLSLGIILFQKKADSQAWRPIIFGFAFIAITLFYPIGHWLIGLKFPFDRALIYWFLFGQVAFIVLIDHLQKGQTKSTLLFLLWTLAFPIAFLQQFDLKAASFQSWRKEQIPESYYHQAEAEKVQSIGGSYLLAPQWYYYQLKFGAPLPAFQKSAAPIHQLQLSQEQYPKPSCSGNFWSKCIHQPIYRTVAPKDYHLQDEALVKSHQDTAGFHITEIARDSGVDAFSLGTEIRLKAKAQKLSVVMQGFNADGESIHFEAYEAKHYLKPDGHWQEWRLFVVLEEVDPAVEKLKFFLWNPKAEHFSLRNLHWQTWQEFEK